jgi:hypothetical protein
MLMMQPGDTGSAASPTPGAGQPAGGAPTGTPRHGMAGSTSAGGSGGPTAAH